ncbi:hypothetical protein F5Y18DRAFT_411816 [Xylariaceae sp. FL1019]|nr:hypothetical protein F5Y18DRAFT_411816 [Xylariaceae sp. FL1019]
MSSRRRNQNSKSLSTEPQDAPVTRQTRSSARLAGISEAPPPEPPKPKVHYDGIPQRGTRRRTRNKSIESVATQDFQSTPRVPEYKEAEEDIEAIDSDLSDDSSSGIGADRLQDIIDFDIPKLNRWTEKAYAAVEALTLPQTTEAQRKGLKATRKALLTACHSTFGTVTAYIDRSTLNLPYDEVPGSRAHIDRVARLANLTSLLISAAYAQVTDKDLLPFISELDKSFHWFFDSEFGGNPDGNRLGFRIRWRHFLEKLDSAPNTKPAILAGTLFCDQSPVTVAEAIHNLKEGPFRQIGDADMDTITSHEGFEAEFEEIITILSKNDRAKVKKGLNEVYRRDDILQDLQSWAGDMYKKWSQTRPATSPAPASPRNEKRDEQQSSGLFVDQEDEASSESETEPEEYDKLPQTSTQPTLARNPAVLKAIRLSEQGITNRSITGPSPDQQAGNGKEIESQTTTAIRQLDPAQFMDKSPSRDISPLRDLSPPQEIHETRKRRQPIHNDDDSIHDEFEVNEQLVDESRRIRFESEIGRGNTRRPPKRARVVPEAPRHTIESSRTRQTSDPFEDSDDPPPSSLTQTDLAKLKARVEANKRRARANKERPAPQIRKEWTVGDIERLLTLIADPDIHCSWAVMEKKQGFETYRNQQSIRDKARNLKKDYLIGDNVLPEGFDGVRLGQKERNQIVAANRNPDRMEDDLDEENGQITNHRP